MSSNGLGVFGGLIWFLTVVTLTFAHHGAAEYDREKTITVTGTVTHYKLANPHVEIMLEVKNDDGATVEWRAEGNSANTMRRLGWNRNTLKPGDRVTLMGGPSVNGKPLMRLDSAVLPDGTKLLATRDTL
jgi:hypothetical protein